MLDITRLAGTHQCSREPLMRLFPQTPPEIAKPFVDPARFEHRAQQSTIGPRNYVGDLRRDVAGWIGRERIERANAVLVLFVHEKPHEVGLVGELVVEGADPDACRLADLMDGGSVAGLSKCGPGCG